MKRVGIAAFAAFLIVPAMVLASKGFRVNPFPSYDNGGLPDLAVDGILLVSSLQTITRTFSATSCELEEGSIGAAGTRRLLRFDVAIVNGGDGDLIAGDPADPYNPYHQWFVFAPCHGHYHITGFTDYQLLDLDRNAVAYGHKQAFCLEDVVKYGTTASHGYTCGNQGITSGWADDYSRSLSGQWVDITGVADGEYILHVAINAAQTFGEGANRYDNVFETHILLSQKKTKS